MASRPEPAAHLAAEDGRGGNWHDLLRLGDVVVLLVLLLLLRLYYYHYYY